MKAEEFNQLINRVEDKTASGEIDYTTENMFKKILCDQHFGNKKPKGKYENDYRTECTMQIERIINGKPEHRLVDFTKPLNQMVNDHLNLIEYKFKQILKKKLTVPAERKLALKISDYLSKSISEHLVFSDILFDIENSETEEDLEFVLHNFNGDGQ